jgi:uncharacterized membrane protein YccC
MSHQPPTSAEHPALPAAPAERAAALLSAPPPGADASTPVDGFSQCHAGMLARLRQAEELPRLLQAAERARALAADLLALVDDAVLEHHADEERELFPAVTRSARPGTEAERVAALVARLVAEHRDFERRFAAIEPALRQAARGKPAQLDARQLQALVDAYRAHAQFEEAQFLPLAQTILGRNDHHMAALGLSLHLRRRPLPVGYI